MTSLPDFSQRRPSVPPPAAAPQLQLPADGLPLRSDQIGVYDPQTTKQLQQIGWQPGDKLPADLPQVVQKALEDTRRQLAAADPKTLQTAHGLSDDFKPKVDAPVAFEDLPAEKKAEIAAYLQEYQRTGQTRAEQHRAALVAQAVGDATPQMPPPAGTSERSAAWERAAVSDTPVQLPTPPRFDRQPEPPQPPPMPPVSAEPPPETSTFDQRCPRCDHRLAALVAEPTAEDVASFLGTAIGGRFIKRYQLFGGQAFVDFRTLLTTEERAIERQLRSEMESRQILTQQQYMADYMRYRLACSIAGFGGPRYPATLNSLPALQEIPFEADAAKPNRTLLTELADWVERELLPQSGQLLAVQTAFADFQRLFETLTWRASSPDFFSRIGTGR